MKKQHILQIPVDTKWCAGAYVAKLNPLELTDRRHKAKLFTEAEALRLSTRGFSKNQILGGVPSLTVLFLGAYRSRSGEIIQQEARDRWILRGAQALNVVDQDGVEEPEDRLQDLLTHLRHYADHHGLNFDEAVDKSFSHFFAEAPKRGGKL